MVWCVVKLGTLSLSCSLSFLFSFPFFFSLPFFFSCSFSYSCSCSCSFLLLSSFLSSLFSSSFSLPFTPPNTAERTDQPTRRPTSRHLNVIWRTAGAQQSVLSPPPLHSLLPPSHTQKKERELFITGIFPARNLFLLQLKIYSKKSPPGEFTGVTVLN